MVNQIDANDTCHFLPSIGDLELLEVLLAAEDSTYPWNPADDTTEDYFHQLEQQVCPQNLEELTSGEANFFLHLDMIWDQIPNYDQEIPNKQSRVNFLHEILDQAFAQFVPSVWLTTIAQTAAKVSTLEQLAGERLVECIQELFPNWNTEDLLVFTRPLAIMREMRSQDLTSSIIHRLEQQEWTNLTEVEQARSICLIADFALKQLDNFHSDGDKTAGEE